jgi:polyhydroxyalkanoate synthesis regulator phasin
MPTMQFDDVRKAIEATFGQLTPDRAKELARQMMEPGAAKEQVAKTAADMLEWSQSNRARIREFVDREIAEQMNNVGVATQSELDALKKRVRTLEREAGMTASGRSAMKKKTAAKKTAAKKTTATKSTAKKTTAKKTTASKRTAAKPGGSTKGPNG